MNDLSGLGKLLIVIGIVSVAAGVVLIYFNKIPLLGKLPGDIYIKGENSSFYFPITTSILLSIMLSLIMYIIRKFM
ncbi:MAG: DUF2905 domain-containing protein [Cytophagaceae bacterium]|nr:DUF2905 domain-containing protein [Cytophagaceae bacterium]MDW8455271.1 DUF2905 domain-containing protein [Cytophagaceae bacterium]